ncbi:MAG: hypothetical protein DRJ07_12385 [Bacteroidetes bacterium]|nr:MAG: hypothetical protein DRJ07_12385 [Bacteroidota bacterium]
MEWYIPITIIPGIGLIIMSTSNIILVLNEEITRLEYSDSKNTDIIRAKTIQLKVLSIAISFQYLGILFFLMSGIAGYLSDSLSFLKYLLITGVGLVTLSILLLLFYSLKAINIRQKHLKI